MKCPFCHSNQTAVLESRVGVDGETLRRRRECGKCERRFTTYERVEGPALMVVKKDGRREPFSREKLGKGIREAFHKRPVAMGDLDALVDETEREILRKGSSEVMSEMIGRLVLKRLKRADKVAWLRFASVYMAFEEIADFEKMIEKEVVKN